jgi:hypothetical protein
VGTIIRQKKLEEPGTSWGLLYITFTKLGTVATTSGRIMFAKNSETNVGKEFEPLCSPWVVPYFSICTGED